MFCLQSQWSPSTAKDQAGSVSLRRGSGATPGLRTRDPGRTLMRKALDMKGLGMKDQVALKFSVISLRSATVISSQ